MDLPQSGLSKTNKNNENREKPVFDMLKTVFLCAHDIEVTDDFESAPSSSPLGD